MASTTTNPAKYQPIKNHHPMWEALIPGHDKCHVRITVVVRIKKATAPTAPVDNANNEVIINQVCWQGNQWRKDHLSLTKR